MDVPENIVDRTVDVAEKALRGLWVRQRAIANNIANVDTPGHKVERFDFDRYMREALSESGPGSTSGYLSRMTSTSFRTDGNNVDIDGELVLLTENSLRYQAVLSQLERKMALLGSVIRDS
ncbi:MAG: flagellar basal body protein [Bacillota bacterium]